MAFGGRDKYESTVSRRARRTYGRGWTRRAIFHGVPADQAMGLVPPESAFWPGESGVDGSVLVDSDIEFDALLRAGKPNYSKVTLFYRPRTWEEWLIAHPNKGVLLCRSAAQTLRVTGVPKAGAQTSGAEFWEPLRKLISYDAGQSPSLIGGTPAGADIPYDVIEGIDPQTGNLWKVVSGTPTIFKPRAVYTIYAIIDNPNHFFYPFVSKVGSFNSNLMMHLPLWPETQREGSWLLIEVRMQPMAGIGKLRRAEYDLMYSEEGWDQSLVSAEYAYSFKQVPVFNAEGEEEGTRAVLQQLATGKTKSPELIRSFNFFNLDLMLHDSWVEQD